MEYKPYYKPYEVLTDFFKIYPGLKGRVQRYAPCDRPMHSAIYIWIDDQKYYYSYGAKVLQPMYSTEGV